jgi:hypothetical protein
MKLKEQLARSLEPSFLGKMMFFGGTPISSSPQVFLFETQI